MRINMKLKDVIEQLEQFCPPQFAVSWDNSGLQVGIWEQEVHTVCLALDATSQVIDFAAERGADLLITHHPLLFAGLKSIHDGDYIGKRVIKLIQNRIACYSMHTNFDVMGMADAAADLLRLREREVLEVTFEDDVAKEGIGRIGKLPEHMTLDEFAAYVKDAFSLDNYRNIFENYNLFSAYRNSIIISGSVALVVILLSGMAAYVLCRYQFHGKKLLTLLLYAGMMFPIYSTIIPVLRMQAGWGIVNSPSVGANLLSVILPQIAGNMSLAIIFLTGYIRMLPMELEEAAYIGGCNMFQTYFRIVFPLCKPSLVTVGIFSFLWSYNDLFTQMFFLRTKENWAITILLNNIASKEGVNYGAMFASVTLIVIPVLVVYLFLNKSIIKGMTVGAVKG